MRLFCFNKKEVFWGGKIALGKLKEEADKIKEVLDRGNVDLVCQVLILNEPALANILHGHYYGTGLTQLDVADFEERKQAGHEVEYYSMRIELASQTVPKVIDLSDGRETYRISRTTKKRWGFKRTAYESVKIDGAFMR